jgi:hypothetical protein
MQIQEMDFISGLNSPELLGMQRVEDRFEKWAIGMAGR